VQPGGDTGWHTHPGPVLVVVKSGRLLEYHENGCVSIYQEGSVFLESPGEAHRVVNDGTTVSEAYATFFVPHGGEPLVPTLEPKPRVCRSHGHGGTHDDRDKP
jgi:quercetin dioxygenase-like cupin family protein